MQGVVCVLIFYLVFLNGFVFAQTPPCGSDYGSSGDEANIIDKMRYGTVQETRNAIYQAMETRDVALGCPQAVVTYQTPDFTEPSLSEIENIWNTVHKPAIEAITIDCPRVGRYENNAALGAYYAMLAGYFDNETILASVNDMMLAQQYISANVSAPIAEHEGAFGYIHVGSLNPCYPGGVVGSNVDALCSAAPPLCITYEFGDFAGEEFAVGDQYPSLDIYDGGIAYDHGWIGSAMIEAAIQQNDSVLKSKYKSSAVLAANWAINEYSVKNHNYTAKLIWLLSQLYVWSNNDIYKNELNQKLDRNLLPGILMDRDSDGAVDSISTLVNFSSLSDCAKTPGRMWDGHNSLPWYGAMNAWAITEAYCAFRDRGDVARAAELKPYLVAMLDNLATEIETLGVIDPGYLGVRDLTYAFLLGVWKVAQYEGEAHANWENALWALWNTGAFDSYNTNSVCVGLYLCVKNNVPFQPLFERQDFNAIQSYTFKPGLSLYPNPSSDILFLDFENPNLKMVDIAIYNLKGSIIFRKKLSSTENQLDVSGIAAGSYVVKVSIEGDETFLEQRFVKF